MQEIYGRKAREMLDEQRRKIASLKPGDVGFGLSYFIPEFDIHDDTLIIDDDGNWLVDHAIKNAAEHRLQSDSATGCPFCGVSAEDIANFNQASAEPPSA